MATCLELISRALTRVGELPQGETADGNYAEDGREYLNALLEQWSLEDLLLYYEKTEEFNLVAGQESYTIGASGADFTTTRPVEILAAQLRDANSLDTDLGIVSNDSYQRIVQKETTNTLPQVISYNPNYPLGEIKVWPSPSSGLKLRLSSNKLFTEVATLDEEISLPPGFKELIVWSLAELFCFDAGRMDIHATIAMKAEEAKATIKRKNVKLDLMSFDPDLYARRRGTYNPFTDQ